MSTELKNIEHYKRAIVDAISQFTLQQLKELWLQVIDTNSNRERKTYELSGMDNYDDNENDNNE